MPNLIAEKCDYCGDVVVKKDHHIESTGRVIVQGGTSSYLVWLCDYKAPAIARPSLSLEGKILCLHCVVPFFNSWVKQLKASPQYFVSRGKLRRERVRNHRTGRFMKATHD